MLFWNDVTIMNGLQIELLKHGLESYRLFGALLLQGKTMIWDATFISRIIRSAILHTAKGAGYRVEAVFCDTPIDICVERNASRDREPVPESTIRRMADSLIPSDRR